MLFLVLLSLYEVLFYKISNTRFCQKPDWALEIFSCKFGFMINYMLKEQIGNNFIASSYY